LSVFKKIPIPIGIRSVFNTDGNSTGINAEIEKLSGDMHLVTEDLV
jgi:hypothetical protein